MKTDEFWIALRVTVVFTVLAVFVQVVLGVVIATLLHNENTNISFENNVFTASCHYSNCSNIYF